MKHTIEKRGIGQRFIAWFACASIVLSAIAPTISHALSVQTTPSGMMKVCTSTGNKFIPISFIIAKANVNLVEQAPVNNSRANKTDKMTGCNSCDQHTATMVALQYAQSLVLALNHADKPTSTFHLNSRSLLLSTSTSPRGPPPAII